MEYSICFTKKEQAECVEILKPLEAAPGFILGRTLYSLISPGTELNHGYLQEHSNSYYPGYASVFIVESIGEGVENVRLGEQRFCMGPHRSFQHVQSNDTLSVPEGLKAEDAVVVRLMSIGLTALTTTAAKPGDHVIVSGAGPVGLLAAFLFQKHGYVTGIVEPSEERRNIAELAGIKQTWAEFPIQDPEWNGRTALVLDCSGHEAAVYKGCQVIRRRGEVVLCGVPWKRYTDLTAQELLHAIFHQYAIVRSGWEWDIPNHADPFSPHSIFNNLSYGLKLLSEGLLQAAPMSRHWSPRQAQEVYAGLAQRRITELFNLFDWSEGI
ncbi:dehydrogenase [Paenibacillus baekrokdamisoli]|uniref:Dehydrogenase n=1 Tax=Paenibacillus baekrokdamisoli TaxID=1712516 RepID=A0A3G9JCP5_9BACL|nr:dehydrogenase [Paenibacillus baekrokdamisoli]MBB3069917.1 threonine dehydrogenase-like Zn-dependent dehydrogenase [Paenibacillus baekrokdamisoli]BBH20729.1 dehydrogenase [Paenibacillus baekrokdamisoli]